MNSWDPSLRWSNVNRESHKHKLEGVQRSFICYCFPGPWHSRPSYDTTLRTLDIPTTISRFDYLCTCLLLGVYGVSMTSVGRIISRSTHLIPGRLSTLISVISGAELMLSITHCLFHILEFGPPYPMMFPVKLSSICFHFHAVCVDVCTFIINCFYFFIVIVSAWFSETL